MLSAAASFMADQVGVDRAKARRVVTRASEPGSEYIARGTLFVFRILAIVCLAAFLASLYFLATWQPALMVVSFLMSRFLFWIWEVLAVRLVRLVAAREQGFLAIGLKTRLLGLEPGPLQQGEAGPEKLVTVTITMPETLVPVLTELAERWDLRLQRDAVQPLKGPR